MSVPGGAGALDGAVLDEAPVTVGVPEASDDVRPLGCRHSPPIWATDARRDATYGGFRIRTEGSDRHCWWLHVGCPADPSALATRGVPGANTPPVSGAARRIGVAGSGRQFSCKRCVVPLLPLVI